MANHDGPTYRAGIETQMEKGLVSGMEKERVG